MFVFASIRATSPSSSPPAFDRTGPRHACAELQGPASGGWVAFRSLLRKAQVRSPARSQDLRSESRRRDRSLRTSMNYCKYVAGRQQLRQLSHIHLFGRKPAPTMATLTRAFFNRSVHAVAPELIGATMLFNGVGGEIVEVEAYHHTDPAAHSYGGRTPRPAARCCPPRPAPAA